MDTSSYSSANELLEQKVFLEALSLGAGSPNTINSKSGLYDIALAWEEVRDYGIDTIKEMARQPREETNMAAIGDCPRAGAWLLPTRKWAVNLQRQPQPDKRTTSRRDGWSYRHCIRRVERDAILPDGSRHDIYFALSQFYASIGMSSEEIEFRLNEIDARNPIRDGDTYIPRVAANAHKYASGIHRCPHPAFEQFCDPSKCFHAKSSLYERYRCPICHLIFFGLNSCFRGWRTAQMRRWGLQRRLNS